MNCNFSNDYLNKFILQDWGKLVEMFNLPKDCNAVDIGANDGESTANSIARKQLFIKEINNVYLQGVHKKRYFDFGELSKVKVPFLWTPCILIAMQ